MWTHYHPEHKSQREERNHRIQFVAATWAGDILLVVIILILLLK